MTAMTTSIESTSIAAELKKVNRADAADIILAIYRGDPEAFEEAVRFCFELITEADTPKTKTLYKSYELRRFLEQAAKNIYGRDDYIGKTHVAVALIRAGYSVQFKDENFFAARVDEARLTARLKKIVNKVEVFDH